VTAAAYNCVLCWSTCGLWATCALPRLMRPWCGLYAPLVLGFAVTAGEHLCRRCAAQQGWARPLHEGSGAHPFDGCRNQPKLVKALPAK
jgi:hypothetical protein